MDREQPQHPQQKKQQNQPVLVLTESQKQKKQEISHQGQPANVVPHHNVSNTVNNPTQHNTQVNNNNQPQNVNGGQDQQQWESFGSDQSIQDRNQQIQRLQQVLQEAYQQLEQAQQSSSNQQPQPKQSSSESQQMCEQQPQSKLGCAHYFRNCEVQAPCCNMFYTCKLCHDDKYEGPKSKGCKVERMAFNDVKNIKCLKCNKIQEASLKCTNPECEITFGKFACLKCKLYENNPAKVNDIFHCDQCGMCRRGKADSFFHCKVCGYCRHISEKNNHKCAQNVAESQCPICLEVLKYSLKKYIALPCGHLIHVQCSAQYRGLNCPVCGMATQKLSQQMNKQIQQQIQMTKANMPKQLADKKVDVLCNQCLHKSYQVPFHFFGIKCLSCGTYNTKMI